MKQRVRVVGIVGGTKILVLKRLRARSELEPTWELPMGKTLLIETIRDNTGASKAKAESALDLLCSKRILEVRGGDPKQNQQAMKCYYPGSNYPAV